MRQSLNLELRTETLELVKDYFTQLKMFKVDHIGYREFRKDGTSMAFCSHLDWYDVDTDVVYKEEMANHYAKELIFLVKNQFDCITRSASSINNKFLQELSSKDMCNSFLIYKNTEDVIYMYAFISSSLNPDALSYFVNQSGFLEELINKYKATFASVFQKSKYQELREQMFSEKVAQHIFSDLTSSMQNSSFQQLTPKEIECTALVARGWNNKAIAKKLNISTRTVEFHLSNIRNKLNINSRNDIVDIAKHINY
ncbi:MAG: hypothetical protein COA94_03335 [Rickettsiales bacterium]|nr:MAG: hypothetical protein COA94_03335 [Rickettsiales bacterium]